MHASYRSILVAVLAVAAFGSGHAAPAPGQGKTQAESAASSRPSTPSPYGQAGLDVRASRLIDMEVKTADGEASGKIRDLIVGMEAERVHYVVLSHGGKLGMGGRLQAVPMSAFKSGGDGTALALDIGPARLEGAPGFDRNRWFDLTDKRYRRQVDRYFGTNGKRAPGPEEQLARASDLIGKKVLDRQGARAGKIAELVINPANARLRYVVLDLDQAWYPDGKLAALPAGAFRFADGKERKLVLTMSPELVASARRFDDKAWPDLNGRFYRREVDAFLARFKAESESRPEQAARKQKDKTDEETSSGNSR